MFFFSDEKYFRFLLIKFYSTLFLNLLFAFLSNTRKCLVYPFEKSGLFMIFHPKIALKK